MWGRAADALRCSGSGARRRSVASIIDFFGVGLDLGATGCSGLATSTLGLSSIIGRGLAMRDVAAI